VSIGITFGLLAGYFGGAIDNVIMRCVDILLPFLPSFLPWSSPAP
jgi:peptide/nickel transport system permease protein